ncbi:beta-hydroxyacyl-ACP dehydratase [Enorma massiliensis]|uniref:3-hydroxyacyl-ACP dehydratase FabZ family protein n=1 Tax=Enorma massiliensis TaxID=1472761 RepID=UPI00195C70A9|nr:3-hydroxyacyl-ACP dehydratase FabZ family protein [Enorma massiliensis]MBM6893150.1 beta-hydroxyacyl-ACP dehydratase [Enorma massiliensis]
MKRGDLKKILPHREPMLLLDEAEVIDGVAHGRITITGDEFFVQGHFPGNPVVPGVILCEMLAQNCCVLMGDGLSGQENVTPFYTSLDKVRFKHPVRPGDTVELTCQITRHRGPFYFASGEARVGDVLCVTAEMSFALMPAE